ncbi:uncharacterized protein K02A2.6-like [Frankliniella occidentalis]|uniref:RNA-directed DNA polymerase n=1 Tax=Frankliniella occidentalis TaxID=133901 RepID=A0A9C6XVP1_FRAOC|nr:uncharacterized protein K02A2.6-like [Frankliniella occidentalis]
MFGITKFHECINGRSNLTIYTDHKPLVGFFKPHAPTPEHISPRLLRCNDDIVPDAVGIHLLELSSGIPVNRKDIVEATQQDPVLRVLYDALSTTWPDVITTPLQPYYNIKMELTTLDGCILRGDRVVVPEVLRGRVLASLHAAHHGMTKMKAIMQSYAWWPGVTTNITDIVKACPTCREHQRNPTPSYTPWPTPSRHWERVHGDFCYVDGQNFLILIDAWSRWPEIYPVRNLTAAELIRCVRTAFATHGVPNLFVSDNGRQLVSPDFENFLARNGCQHLTSAPYFPQSNGLAERTVATFKGFVKKFNEGDWHARTDRALFAMRITPSSATGEAPAVRVFNRPLRTPWDVMKPTPPHPEPEANRLPRLEPGQPVSFRDHRPGAAKFSPGHIVATLGNKMYTVRDATGQIHVRNINQLHRAPPDPPTPAQPRAAPKKDVAADWTVLDIEDDGPQPDPTQQGR